MFRRAAIIGGAALVALVACSGAGPSAVERHAQTAGDVMTRERGPIPARAAALLVTGDVNDTRIDAVDVRGTTWGGSVTLRITVRPQEQPEWSTDSVSTGCFRYSFAYPRRSDWGTAHRVDCASHPVLRLSATGLPSGVTVDTRSAVLRAVSTMPAGDRTVPATVARYIRSAVGPAFTVVPGTADGAAFTWVRYGDTCLSARTSATVTEVSQPIFGDDCFGG